MVTTIGVEEEFILLDPTTLTPVPVAAKLLEALNEVSELPGTVAGEFFASQIEYATPICATAQEVEDSLRAFRRLLHLASASLDVFPAAVGTPFRPDPNAQLTAENRYENIGAAFGRVTREHQINGLHVHVAVPSRDEAVTAMNGLRPWLPVLLALSTNSPFWDGADTDFASWRAIHSRCWTTAGIPPHFSNAADYDKRTAALNGVGGTLDPGTINWVARPSSRFPTLEVRVFDAQIDVPTSAAFAALVRGLVTSGAHGDPNIADELLDASLWHAAKNGLTGTLVDPRSGALVPAEEAVKSLLDAATAGLTDHGDLDRVTTALEQIIAMGTGAARQRQAFAGGGINAVLELLMSTMPTDSQGG